ncbi:MAG: hypothetical protein LBE56_13065 [Tannerella sp.]|jgi:hypothetical protein|nr:hypothetical protein [Tannerella sp.]
MNEFECLNEMKEYYSAPEITVRRISVECPIAAGSVDVERIGPEWIPDDDWEPYDGDIWMPV